MFSKSKAVGITELSDFLKKGVFLVNLRGVIQFIFVGWRGSFKWLHAPNRKSATIHPYPLPIFYDKTNVLEYFLYVMAFNHQSVLEPILFRMFFSVCIHTCWMGDRYLSGNIASRQMSIGPDYIPLWGGRHVHMINIPLSSTSQQIVDELTFRVKSKSQVGFDHGPTYLTIFYWNFKI